MAQIQIAQPGVARTRIRRTPNFPMEGGMKPFGLYPTFFTPVLPGETLDEARVRETAVSSPVVNPLAGAWMETWMFYVKLTDIDRELGGMFIGQLTNPAAYTAGSDKPRYFTKSGQLDWCALASEVVHRHFFLDANETPQTIDGVYKIKRIVNDFTESAVKQSAADDQALPTAQEDVTPQLQAYLAMRQMGMASMDYEEYLRTYGVSSVKVEEGEPEMIAYRRYWTAPSNVINPEDGSPSGAWYWRIDETHSKNHRFKEPGFLIGYHAVRPKVFDATQKASYAGNLWGFNDWIPSYTLHDPMAGIREWDADGQIIFEGVGESGSIDDDLWLDHHDLLTHGEQFINGAGRFAPPTSSYRSFADGATPQELRGQYVTDSDIAALFVTETGDDQIIDYEGLISLKIKGHVQDNT